MRFLTLVAATLGLIAAVACADDAPVSYGREVAPFLERHCLECHDDGIETSGLALHTVQAMLAGGRRGPAIVPGRGETSPLIQYLTGQRQPQMPPMTSIPLDEIAVIRRWIDEGAKVDDLAPVEARRAEARRLEESSIALVDAPPPVTGLAYRPDGKALAVASYREAIVVNPADGKSIRRLAGPPDQVTAVAFSPDGTRLAGASGLPGSRGEVRIWDAQTWSELVVLRGHSDTILAVAWRPGDSHELATASLDKLIQVWDTSTGAVVRTIRSHADIVDALAYDPSGTWLASGSADKTAKVYDTTTGLQIAGLNGHNEAVLQVAFSPDGKRLATAGADGQIRLWDPEKPENPLRGFGHTGPVYGLAWRPDGESVWGGSGGRPSVLSYKVGNGNRVVDIKGETMPQDWVYAVAFPPDGRTVAAGGWEGSVIFWDLSDGSLIRKIVPGRD